MSTYTPPTSDPEQAKSPGNGIAAVTSTRSSPDSTLYSSAQMGGNPYSVYNIATRYQKHFGLYQLPPAGPLGLPCEIVRLHTPFATKTVTWVAERMGADPILPDPDTGNANEVLAHSEITNDAPPPLPGGQSQVFRVRGTYIYYLQRMPAPTDMIDSATTEMVVLPAVSYAIGPQQFSKDILASAGAQSGASTPVTY